MTNHREEPEDRVEDADRESGPDGTGKPGTGPGWEPDREAPGGRPSGGGPAAADRSGQGRSKPGRGAGPDPGEAGPEAAGDASDDGANGPGDGAEGSGRGRRGARRAWGDAFSEVQDVVGEVVGDVLEGVREAAAGRFPRMDLLRIEGEGYRLLVDLPGLGREDVEVLTLGNELTIRGERPRPELPEGSEILRSERAHGRFERTIRMPPEVREEGVAASFEDGVLTVRLPRTEPSEARAVDIG